MINFSKGKISLLKPGPHVTILFIAQTWELEYFEQSENLVLLLGIKNNAVSKVEMLNFCMMFTVFYQRY